MENNRAAQDLQSVHRMNGIEQKMLCHENIFQGSGTWFRNP